MALGKPRVNVSSQAGDEEDSRHATGAVPAQGLLCGGLDKQVDAVGIVGAECAIHIFPSSFPQSHHSREIWGGMGGYGSPRAPQLMSSFSPLTSLIVLICKIRTICVVSGPSRKHTFQPCPLEVLSYLVLPLT